MSPIRQECCQLDRQRDQYTYMALSHSREAMECMYVNVFAALGH